MYKNNSGLGASSKPLFYIFIFYVKSKRCVSKSATILKLDRCHTLSELIRHKMNNPIVEFLSKYIELTNEEIDILSNQNFIQSYKKGTILLSEGKIAKECFFIIQGCVGSYYLVDGQVKVTEFFTEKQPITPVSYTTKKPSKYYLECLEDCIISLGTPERSAELMKKIPRLATLGSNIMEDQLANQRMKYDEFIKLSPEDRYQNLQKTSTDLLNRVPQYLIASYLGIKPESLSRIRKRLHKKSSS